MALAWADRQVGMRDRGRQVASRLQRHQGIGVTVPEMNVACDIRRVEAPWTSEQQLHLQCRPARTLAHRLHCAREQVSADLGARQHERILLGEAMPKLLLESLLGIRAILPW